MLTSERIAEMVRQCEYLDDNCYPDWPGRMRVSELRQLLAAAEQLEQWRELLALSEVTFRPHTAANEARVRELYAAITAPAAGAGE